MLKSAIICIVYCRSSFAALAQQSGTPTFGGLAHQGSTFGSPQPAGGFGAFGSGTSKFVVFSLRYCLSLFGSIDKTFNLKYCAW